MGVYLQKLASKMGLSSKLVIRRNRSIIHTFILVVMSSMAMTLILLTYFDRSQWAYITSNLSEWKSGNALLEANRVLQHNEAELQEKFTMLESNMRLERQTIESLRQNMIEQQEHVYKLKDDLAFYKNIISSIEQSDGLYLQGLRITEASRPRNYFFQAVLTYVSSDNKVIMGKLSIVLEGIQADGAKKNFNVQELTLSESLSLDFEFESFHSVIGGIMLPQDFIVHNVVVEAYIEQKGKKKEKGSIKRVFDWAEVLISK